MQSAKPSRCVTPPLYKPYKAPCSVTIEQLFPPSDSPARAKILTDVSPKVPNTRRKAKPRAKTRAKIKTKSEVRPTSCRRPRIRTVSLPSFDTVKTEGKQQLKAAEIESSQPKAPETEVQPAEVGAVKPAATKLSPSRQRLFIWAQQVQQKLPQEHLTESKIYRKVFEHWRNHWNKKNTLAPYACRNWLRALIHLLPQSFSVTTRNPSKTADDKDLRKAAIATLAYTGVQYSIERTCDKALEAKALEAKALEAKKMDDKSTCPCIAKLHICLQGSELVSDTVMVHNLQELITEFPIIHSITLHPFDQWSYRPDEVSLNLSSVEKSDLDPLLERCRAKWSGLLETGVRQWFWSGSGLVLSDGLVLRHLAEGVDIHRLYPPHIQDAMTVARALKNARERDMDLAEALKELT